MIAIIDYGLGNLGSIQNMIKKTGGQSVITRDHSEIEKADKILLPGVGAFDVAMNNLEKYNLLDILNKQAFEHKKWVMGVCLGMQLLAEESEEGKNKGLGWIPGTCRKFKFENKSLKVPHMGWSQLKVNVNHPMLKDLADNNRFYFVHSYYIDCKNNENVLTYSDYGFNFASAVIKENIFGFQFHPEKSHKFGFQLFKNFIGL